MTISLACLISKMYHKTTEKVMLQRSDWEKAFSNI